MKVHAAFGGVVPELAARAHAEKIDLAVESALAEAGLSLADIDAIAVTAGPGLIGGVLAGVMCAKGLAAGSGLPLVGVNHLAGHALTPRLTDGLAFPYLMLLVSGGHCQFLIAHAADHFTRWVAPSTTPRARRSTRSRAFSALASPAARRSGCGPLRRSRPLRPAPAALLDRAGLRSVLLGAEDRGAAHRDEAGCRPGRAQRPRRGRPLRRVPDRGGRGAGGKDRPGAGVVPGRGAGRTRHRRRRGIAANTRCGRRWPTLPPPGACASSPRRSGSAPTTPR